MALKGRQERDVVVARLLERRDHFGGLTSAEIDEAAAACDVARSTVYRWLHAGTSSRRTLSVHILTEAQAAAFFRARGDAAAAHRDLLARGEPGTPSLSTYRRAIKREFDAAARSAARRGLPGRDQARIVLKHAPRHRNERWEGDHKKLEVRVVAPGLEKPVRPWISWLIDVGSRGIVGWGLSAGAPNRGSVLAAIRCGVERRGEDPFYGVPGELLWDNGLEFTASAVTEAAAMLGSVARTTFPYSPQQKPFIESLNGTFKEQFVAKLPHFTDGPARKDGSLEDADDRMLSLSELAHLVDQWVEHYNFERPHQGLSGKTPAEQWTRDPAPIRAVSAEAARHFTLERVSRRVRRDGGIHVDSVAYIAPELYGLEGEEIEVGRIPYDLTRVEVFKDGSWICTATPTVRTTPAQAMKLREAAKRQDERLMRERRRLAKEGRVRIGTITHDALDPRILPPKVANPESERRDDPFGFGSQIGGVR